MKQKHGKGMNGLEPRVFVVNGEQSTQKILADLLATKNYSVEIFSGATEFLARAPHRGPACVVLELLRQRR